MSTIIIKKTLAEAYANRSITFIPNVGQFDSRVCYFAHSKGCYLYFLSDRIVFDFVAKTDNAEAPEEKQDAWAAAIALVFDQSNSGVELQGHSPGAGGMNFFLGNNPAHWYSNICSYGELLYRELWPGVDLLIRDAGGELKFDWTVHPGGLPDQIVMRYEGVDSLELDDAGNLLVHHALGTMTDTCPFAYQELDSGKTVVACPFVKNPQARGDMTVGFEAEAYDTAHPLCIDPAMNYTTYLGGSGTDFIRGIAVDETGNAYFVGQTSSGNFPVVVGAYQPALAGITDVFVTKISPDGSSLIYSTYLGGTSSDDGLSITIDSSGAAYVTGYTTSTDFPTVGPYQAARAGSQDAFVSKLSPNGGSLTYSTYLGGTIGQTTGRGIAVNAFGQTYVAGETSSASFPTTGSSLSPSYNGGTSDCFVSLLSSSGGILLVSTYLGGSGADIAYDLALDASDFVYITGSTDSVNFPTTTGAFQTAFAGNMDAFVAKLEGDVSALVYSTYLGGSDGDEALAVALDSTNRACVTGVTSSANFPVTAGAFQTALAGANDAFITKLSADGGSLVFSTYLGGSEPDTGSAITLDSAGHIWVAGYTSSANFPITPSVIPSALTGTVDWFISMLSADGSNLMVSYYLGGTSQQEPSGIAVDGLGAVYVVGYTDSNDFPVTAGAFQTVFAGDTDGAATKAFFATYRMTSVTIMELLS